MSRCKECMGEGRHLLTAQKRKEPRTVTCLRCRGTGRTNFIKCLACGGVGWRKYPSMGVVHCGRCNGRGVI